MYWEHDPKMASDMERLFLTFQLRQALLILLGAQGARPNLKKTIFQNIYFSSMKFLMHIDAFCKCCLSEALIRTSSDLLACFSASTLRTPYDDAWLLELPRLRHGVRANRDSARRHIETDDFILRIPAQQL